MKANLPLHPPYLFTSVKRPKKVSAESGGKPVQKAVKKATCDGSQLLLNLVVDFLNMVGLSG